MILTAADSEYFFALMTLITTKFHIGKIPEVPLHILDLGLSPEQASMIRLLAGQNIFLHDVKELGLEPFDGAYQAGRISYAWKANFIKAMSSHERPMLWIDAGIAISSDLNKFFLVESNQGARFFSDFAHNNVDWTSTECLELMETTDLEKQAPQIHSGLIFFTNIAQSKKLIDEWSKWSDLSKVSISIDNKHRHDQSILSILLCRYGYIIEKDEQVCIQSRDFKFAHEKAIPFLIHRRQFSWIDFNSLLSTAF